jgi:FkbM family methyltransferase
MTSSVSKLLRIPGRIADDAKIIKLVANWKEFLAAKLHGRNINRLYLRNGVTIETPDEMDLNFLFHEIWLDEIYGPKGFEIADDNTVIDIGGNIGVFAIYAATRALNVQVFSFEPFPKNAEYFRSNIEKSHLDKSVNLQNIAVAGQNGKRTLRIATSWGCHSLTAGNDVGDLEVDCTTLNDIISNVKTCNFLKIDCEGGEYEILRNASEPTLRSIERIASEYHNNEQGTGPELRKFLEEKNFRINRFDEIDERSGMLYATNLEFQPLL